MIAERFRRYLENRLPRNASWTLGQGNIYILPTRAGWAYAVTLLVMLLASINYQLNLGYALTFLLCGSGLVAMHQTHTNLRRLTLHLKAPMPVFAGERALLEVVLTNPGGERHGIGVGVHRAGPTGMAWVDVPAEGSTTARLAFVPQPPFGFAVVQVLWSIALYPLVVGLSRLIFDLRKPAMGEIDDFGRRL